RGVTAGWFAPTVRGMERSDVPRVRWPARRAARDGIAIGLGAGLGGAIGPRPRAQGADSPRRRRPPRPSPDAASTFIGAGGGGARGGAAVRPRLAALAGRELPRGRTAAGRGGPADPRAGRRLAAGRGGVLARPCPRAARPPGCRIRI